MTSGAVAIAIALPLGLVLLLALQGLLDGDRPDDAVVCLRLVPGRHPEHQGLDAALTVECRSSGPCIVTARARPLRAVRLVGAVDARRTALRHRRSLAGVELLGAVQAHGSRAWLLPLPVRAARAVRVVVEIEQAGGRRRVFTFSSAVEATGRLRDADARRGPSTAASPQASSPRGARDVPKDRR